MSIFKNSTSSRRIRPTNQLSSQTSTGQTLPSSPTDRPDPTPTAHKSPARRPGPGAGSGSMRLHYRGNRAGRVVQARRQRARNAEQQRRQDLDRTLIPLSGPGLAPGIGEGPTAQTRDRPGPAAGCYWRGSGGESLPPCGRAICRDGPRPTETAFCWEPARLSTRATASADQLARGIGGRR